MGPLSVFPTPYTVQTKQLDKSGSDAHGNPVESWADPIDQKVIGWATPHIRIPKSEDESRTLVDVELYVLPDFVCGPRDRVILPDGDELEAAGYPEDYNHGPFNWRPGMVVQLVRVEG